MLNPCKISSHPIHSMQSSHKSIRIINIKIKRTIARDMTLTGVHSYNSSFINLDPVFRQYYYQNPRISSSSEPVLSIERISRK